MREWKCNCLLFFVQQWVANFEKPKGDPSAFLKPATTVLSPYLKVSNGKREERINIVIKLSYIVHY